jgi:hypothetical protein
LADLKVEEKWFKEELNDVEEHAKKLAVSILDAEFASNISGTYVPLQLFHIFCQVQCIVSQLFLQNYSWSSECMDGYFQGCPWARCIVTLYELN